MTNHISPDTILRETVVQSVAEGVASGEFTAADAMHHNTDGWLIEECEIVLTAEELQRAFRLAREFVRMTR